MKPNYTKIYLDLIKYKKKEDTVSDSLLKKIKNIEMANDVFEVERELFGNNGFIDNQKLKSYDEMTIKIFLNYQKQNSLTNMELSDQYKISRNTIAKWKKIYGV
ncbi:hypothetical protein GCM10023210_09540 [Chryseobacterium ginsengisoli]|uniref:Transposase n=1 Tax=Chryseobacterium ginsengisoli TaxID=363853 RepID=A0ABP9M1J9_9FLAO